MHDWQVCPKVETEKKPCKQSQRVANKSYIQENIEWKWAVKDFWQNEKIEGGKKTTYEFTFQDKLGDYKEDKQIVVVDDDMSVAEWQNESGKPDANGMYATFSITGNLEKLPISALDEEFEKYLRPSQDFVNLGADDFQRELKSKFAQNVSSDIKNARHPWEHGLPKDCDFFTKKEEIINAQANCENTNEFLYKVYRHLILDQGNNKELVDRFRRYFSWRLAKKTLKNSGDAWRHFSWGESMGEPGFEPMQVAVNHKKNTGGFVDDKKSLYSFWQELKASGCGLFSMIAIDARNGKLGLDSMSVADWYRIYALRAYQPEVTVVDKKQKVEKIELPSRKQQIVFVIPKNTTGLVDIFGIELNKSWLLTCTKQTTNAHGVTTETFNPAGGQQCKEIASKLKAAQEKNKGMILEARHGEISGGHDMPVFKDGDNWVLRDHGGGRKNRVFNLNTASDVWKAVKLHLIESKNENKIKYHEKGLIRLYERHYGSTK